MLKRQQSQALTLTQMTRQLFDKAGTLKKDLLPALKAINPTIECIERFQLLIRKVQS